MFSGATVGFVAAAVVTGTVGAAVVALTLTTGAAVEAVALEVLLEAAAAVVATKGNNGCYYYDHYCHK